jgi:sugar lactone lactonase YvrE
MSLESRPRAPLRGLAIVASLLGALPVAREPHAVAALAVGLGIPRSLTVDARGNVYIGAETPGRSAPIGRIFRVDRAGQLTVVAGSGEDAPLGPPPTSTGNDLPPLSTRLESPVGLVLEPSGSLLFADETASRIFRLDVVGGRLVPLGGPWSPLCDEEAAAPLLRPAALALAQDGSIAIADRGDHRVKRLDPRTGVICTLAGDGLPGDLGDGGPGRQARLNSPEGLALDPSSSLLIADRGNHRVRRLSLRSGLIDSLAGTEHAGSEPSGLALNSRGDLFIADKGNKTVRRMSRSGLITTVPLADFTEAAPRGSVPMQPSAIAVDRSGRLLVADAAHRRIFSLEPRGRARAIAGNGGIGYCGDGKKGLDARLREPYGMALDGKGHLYLADSGQNRVRRLDLAGGEITTVAGDGSAAFLGDEGPATRAALNHPRDVAVDAVGNLFIADTGNNRIRHVSPEGRITSIAGTDLPGSEGDGGPATHTQLAGPVAVLVDLSGDLLVAEMGSRLVRRISRSDGTITTFAGSLRGPSLGDGQAATLGRLGAPGGLTMNREGDLFVSEGHPPRVRRIDSKSRVATTVIDDPTLGNVARLAVDRSGALFLADPDTQRVLRVDPGSRQLQALVAEGWGRIRPSAVASGLAGELFVTDLRGYVWRIDPQGVAVCLAGGGWGF